MSNKINNNSKKQILIIYIVLILATLAVFWQVKQCNFVNFDDQIYVTANNHIQSGITLDGIRWAFSTTYAEFWHPLTWLSLMFDYQLYSLNPGGYHVTNLILHILSTLLLFWLFHRMTGALWRSAFVAAFFALHPLHVESVAWISERKDVLSAFFWMLTLCLYVYYTEKPVIRRYLLVVFSFVCALMSKPMVVTLPVIMMLLDYWPLNRFETKKDHPVLWQVKEKLPFFLLSAVFSIITIYAQRNLFTNNFSLAARFANALVSFVTYLEKTFWPYDLAVFYPFSNNLPIWQILGATLLIVIISIRVIMVFKRLPFLCVGWFWYIIALLPVLGIVRSTSHSMHDCYNYLPSVGFYIILAWGIPSLIKSDNVRKKILFPAAISAGLILAAITWQQCGYWGNTIRLWNHALKVTENNYMAHTNLAADLLKRGKINEAIDHLGKAISIMPSFEIPYYDRGIAYYHLGMRQRALDDFKKATRIKPDYTAAYYNMGIIYMDLGEYQSAIANYSEAIRLNPDYAYAYNDRALVYFKQSDPEHGCPDVKKACLLGVCKVLEWSRSKGFCR